MSRSAIASFIASTIVWIVVGVVGPIAFRSISFEDLQRLEQVWALRPGPALVDGAAAIVTETGSSTRVVWVGEVGVADEASVGPRPGVDAAGDRPAVKGVGHQPEPARAVDRPARSGRRDRPGPRRRPGSPASARSRRATARGAGGRARISRVGPITCAKVIVPNRSSSVRQASSAPEPPRP